MTNTILKGITPNVAPAGHHDFCGCGPFYTNPICEAEIKRINPSWYYAHHIYYQLKRGIKKRGIKKRGIK